MRNVPRRRASRKRASEVVCTQRRRNGPYVRLPRRNFGVYFNFSRQFAYQRVGFVLILPTTLRLGLTHTRLNGLRAANSSLPVGVLSVASVSLSSCPLCLVRLSRVSR